MWALAAERVFRTDVNVMVINAKSEYLSDTPMWKMWDIERQVCDFLAGTSRLLRKPISKSVRGFAIQRENGKLTPPTDWYQVTHRS